MDRPGSAAISPAHAQGLAAPPPDAEPSVIARIHRAVFDDVPVATKIGRYYLLDEVGRGGLGIVYPRVA